MRKNIVQILLCGVLCILSSTPCVQGSATPTGDAFKNELMRTYNISDTLAEQIVARQAQLIGSGTVAVFAKRQAIAEFEDLISQSNTLIQQTTQNTKQLKEVYRQSQAPGISSERAQQLQAQAAALQKTQADLQRSRDALAEQARQLGWGESVIEAVKKGAPIPLPRGPASTTPAASPTPSTASSSSDTAASVSPKVVKYMRDLGVRVSLARGVEVKNTGDLKKIAAQCATLDATSLYSFDGSKMTRLGSSAPVTQSSSSSQPSSSKPSSSSPIQKPASSGPSTVTGGIKDLAQRIIIAPGCEITDFKTFTRNLADIVRAHPKAQYFSDGQRFATRRQIRRTIRASQALGTPSTSIPPAPPLSSSVPSSSTPSTSSPKPSQPKPPVAQTKPGLADLLSSMQIKETRPASTAVPSSTHSDADWEKEESVATTSQAPEKEIITTYQLLADSVENREYRTALGEHDRKIATQLEDWWTNHVYKDLLVRAESEYQAAMTKYNALPNIRRQNTLQPQKMNPPKIAPATARQLTTLIQTILRIVIINALFRGKSLTEAEGDADMHWDDISQTLLQDYGTAAKIINYYNTRIKDSLTITLQEVESGRKLAAATSSSSPSQSPTRPTQGDQQLNLSIAAQQNLLQEAVARQRNPNYDDSDDESSDDGW